MTDTNSPGGSRLRVVCALLVLALFVAGALGRAHVRPLWHDELFTLAVAEQPGVVGIWQALQTGVDLNPPLYYLLVQQTARVVATESLAVRLPAVLGFALMLGSVAAFVRARCGSIVGGAAAATIALSGVAPYAYEGRPYGLVLGCAGLALLAWQQVDVAPARVTRAAWTLVLFVALAAAVSSHYYAVLLPLPIAIGEGVRTVRHGRWRPGTWAALGLPLALVWAWRPLIDVAQRFAPAFWSPPTPDAAVVAYRDMLATLGGPLAVALSAIAVIAGLTRTGWLPPARTPRGRAGVPGHELAALAAFSALPIAGVLLALFATGAWHERYAVSAIVGIAGLVAAGLHASGTLALRTVSTALLLAFAAQSASRALDWRVPPRAPAALTLVGSRATSLLSMPMLVSDGLTFVELTHYAPRALVDRLAYALKPPSVIARTGTDTENRALQQLARLTSVLRLERFETFLARDRPFAVIGRTSWVMEELRARGLPLQWLAADGDVQLFVVDPTAVRPTALTRTAVSRSVAAPAASIR